MKIGKLWSAAITASTFSVLAFSAQEVKAMSFTLDFTDNSVFFGAPSSISNVNLGGVNVNVNATTRGGEDSRLLTFNNAGVGILGDGIDNISGSAGIDNDEVLELTFSKLVRFTSINFVGITPGSDDFALRIDGTIFGADPTPISSNAFNFVSPGTDFGALFRIETRDNNDRFRINSISGEVIPTPALLPGLLGLGVAAWRRRRQDATDA